MSNPILAKFLESPIKTYTPLAELELGKSYQIKYVEKKDLKHGESVLVTLDDERVIILPNRLTPLFLSEVIKVVNDGTGTLYMVYYGMKTLNGKTMHHIAFSEEI
jgi:hypothetical protein